MAKIISAQHYRDDAIVAQKREVQDYDVTISPEFEYEGESYQIVVDGHHSLSAALLDGVEPVFTIATPKEDNAIGASPEDYLEIHRNHGDGDYYDISTGKYVW